MQRRWRALLLPRRDAIPKRIALLTVFFLLACESGATGPPARGPLSPATVEYRQDLNAGPVSSENTPGLRLSTVPGVVTEWVDGTYHMVGAYVDGDASIHNHPRILPLGGLDARVGADFKFVSFPTAGPVWIMGTTPTDGISGADNKPIASIRPDGRLVLHSSNRRSEPAEAVLDYPLALGQWYRIEVHGRNGVNATQEILLYGGCGVVASAQVAWTVAGKFIAPIDKWGFGTRQDAAGLEYYLDNLYHVGS